MEEALYDVPLHRDFAGLDGGMTRLPDESTILRFRHLLETHGLATQMLALVNEILVEKCLMLKTGSVVDATLIPAPTSTKNGSGKRDPEMRPTQKGGNWYFGMKAHIGVRCGVRPGSHGDRHGGQRARHHRGRSVVARERNGCVR
jgi:transposase, IS5 family